MSAETTSSNVNQIYFKRKSDIFHQNAFANISENSSKLRTYSLLKTEPGFENYLSDILSVKDRTALTKFRLSNHPLMIEKMRHLKPKPEISERRCPFCPELVEDESHFLLTCKNFTAHRTPLTKHANDTIPGFDLLNNEQKFTNLFDPRTITETAKYLRKAFEVREFLLKPHKGPG